MTLRCTENATYSRKNKDRNPVQNNATKLTGLRAKVTPGIPGIHNGILNILSLLGTIARKNYLNAIVSVILVNKIRYRI